MKSGLMQIVVRSDLLDVGQLIWNSGASDNQQRSWTHGMVAAQAAHAATAIIQSTYQDTATQQYISQSNLPNMRKVVLKVGILTFQDTLNSPLDTQRTVPALPQRTALATREDVLVDRAAREHRHGARNSTQPLQQS